VIRQTRTDVVKADQDNSQRHVFLRCAIRGTSVSGIEWISPFYAAELAAFFLPGYWQARVVSVSS